LSAFLQTIWPSPRPTYRTWPPISSACANRDQAHLKATGSLIGGFAPFKAD
jgi:hypothetical protein